MIILDLEVDNYYSFKNFHVNFTYPKKIVGSNIQDEYLIDHPNFRYKKVNIIMGANASGKTTLGYMLRNIFNFISRKNVAILVENIANPKKKASFVLEMVCSKDKMYRIRCEIVQKPDDSGNMTEIIVNLHVTSVMIGMRDSYEICKKKLDDKEDVEETTNYVEELDKIDELYWLFEHPDDVDRVLHLPQKDTLFPHILKNVLMTLDPAITNVELLKNVKNSYVIRMPNRDIVIQDGEKFSTKLLSSGTKAGVEVAVVMSSLIQGKNSFYYCDEKFSYISSDSEKAILGVMIDSIRPNEQLFFTTHNIEVLDMDLPKHSYSFMKKDVTNKEEPIKCLNASDYLKRNTDSLKRAVENDMFSVAPSTDLIYEILDLKEE